MKKMYTIIASLLMSSVALSQNNESTDCSINCIENLVEIALPGTNSKNVNYTLSFECDNQSSCEITHNNFSITEQGDNNHAINTNWNNMSWMVANDFDVEEGETISISKFIPTLINYASNADIYFFENNDGVPGELIISFLDIAADNINFLGNTEYDNPVYESTYLLPANVELNSGKYWVAIHADYLNPPHAYASVYWGNSVNAIAEGGHHAYKSSDGGTTWNTSGSMQLADGAFKLAYECDGVELIRTNGPASGESFPIGETIITHELKYGETILDTCTFTVTVNEAPVICSIECPENIDVETSEDMDHAIVTYEILKTCETEGITAEVVLVQGLASGSEFPIGETIVTHNLVYNEEILDTCTFKVTVEQSLSINDTYETNFILYPNPVSDILTIHSSHVISSIQVYSVSGALIRTIEINENNTEINLSDLSSGIYFIKNNSKDNSMTHKIIKQ